MNRKLLTMAVAGLLSVAGLSAQEPQLKWVTSQDGMGLEIPITLLMAQRLRRKPVRGYPMYCRQTVIIT